MASRTFNIWQTNSGVTLIRDGISNLDIYFLEEEIPTRKIVHTFVASSYVEAMQKHYDFNGFGTYKPMIDPETNLPYPEHFEEFPD